MWKIVLYVGFLIIEIFNARQKKKMRNQGEENMRMRTYSELPENARAADLKSIAFPSISTGDLVIQSKRRAGSR